jgi:hypothetical protein
MQMQAKKGSGAVEPEAEGPNVTDDSLADPIGEPEGDADHDGIGSEDDTGAQGALL